MLTNHALTAAMREALRRVIAIANRKGGVGKSSISTNVAGACAASDYRVLLFDFDSQGNAGDDLGYRGTDIDDEGLALFNALVLDQPLVPKSGVRPNLDVVPAGRHTASIADSLAGMIARGQDPSYTFAKKLAEIADQYDIILIDCPPGDAILQTLALVAARWVLIPTQPDDGSLQGLTQLAERVIETKRDKNPELEPLGVVLFPVVKSGTKMQADVRTKLAGIMGDAAPVFTSTIRFAQAAGVDARARGQLAIELARDAQEQDRFAWTKRLKARQSGESLDDQAPKRLAESAGGLAGDYLELTAEILQTLSEQERIAAENAGVV